MPQVQHQVMSFCCAFGFILVIPESAGVLDIRMGS